MRNGSRLRASAIGLASALLLCGGSGCFREEPAATVQPVSPFPRPFQIIGHRGAAGYAPENTLPAFRRAQRMGVVEVELDVQLTRDDRLILFHDETLDAKTDLAGRVRDHALAALEEAEIGSWFDRTHPEAETRFAGARLASLDSLFAEMGDAFVYHVELKDEEPELPARTLERIDRFGLRSRVIVTSFSFEQLRRMHELAPELPTCLLIRRRDQRDGSLDDWIERAAGAGFREVAVAASELDPERVSAARTRGLWIRAWGVRSLADMDRVIAAGANGMTIDWPDALIARFLEHAGSAGARGRD